MIRVRSRRQTTAADPAPDVYPTDDAELAAGDHGLHVTNETCARCHRPIGADDEARRTATGECVHLCC